MIKVAAQDLTRFFAGVDVRPGENACWVWVLPTTNGYGYIKIDGRRQRAHRVAFVIATGIQPGSLEVCHHCDNPACVRPDHLFLGTHLDNMRDRDRKGRCVPPMTRVYGEKHGSHTQPHRRPRGERHGSAKLDAARVRVIRSELGKKTHQQIADAHGVSRSLIGQIASRRIWSHLEGA